MLVVLWLALRAAQEHCYVDPVAAAIDPAHGLSDHRYEWIPDARDFVLTHDTRGWAKPADPGQPTLAPYIASPGGQDGPSVAVPGRFALPPRFALVPVVKSRVRNALTDLGVAIPEDRELCDVGMHAWDPATVRAVDLDPGTLPLIDSNVYSMVEGAGSPVEVGAAPERTPRVHRGPFAVWEDQLAKGRADYAPAPQGPAAAAVPPPPFAATRVGSPTQAAERGAEAPQPPSPAARGDPPHATAPAEGGSAAALEGGPAALGAPALPGDAPPGKGVGEVMPAVATVPGPVVPEGNDSEETLLEADAKRDQAPPEVPTPGNQASSSSSSSSDSDEEVPMEAKEGAEQEGSDGEDVAPAGRSRSGSYSSSSSEGSLSDYKPSDAESVENI